MTTAAQAASAEPPIQARIDSALAEQANDNAAAAAAALALAATEKAEVITAAVEQATLDANAATAAAAAAAVAEETAHIAKDSVRTKSAKGVGDPCTSVYLPVKTVTICVPVQRLNAPGRNNSQWSQPFVPTAPRGGRASRVERHACVAFRPPPTRARAYDPYFKSRAELCRR